MPFEQIPEKKFELPTGKARELTKEYWQDIHEHLLLFDKVDNRVIFANDEVFFPLKLKEGESSPLGVFAEKALSKELENIEQLSSEEKKKIMEAWPFHQRSALLGRIIFADKEGRTYRDIDVKGIGSLQWLGMGKARVSHLGERLDPGIRGLLDEDMAFYDMQMSEEFTKAGIRTSRVLGIIKLNEMIYHEEKISIEQAKKKDIIDKDFNPVIAVRAFGTRARIEDFGRRKKEKLLLEDAQRLVEQERGKKFSSGLEYLKWFAETLGKNVGLCHKNKWVHGYLISHNITLDCRIVDLDSVIKSTKIKDFKQDFDTAINSLRTFIHKNEIPYSHEQFKELLNLFKDSYFQSGGNPKIFGG